MDEQKKSEEPQNIPLFRAYKTPDNAIGITIDSNANFQEISFAFRLLNIEIDKRLIINKVKQDKVEPKIITGVPPRPGGIINFMRNRGRNAG